MNTCMHAHTHTHIHNTHTHTYTQHTHTHTHTTHTRTHTYTTHTHNTHTHTQTHTYTTHKNLPTLACCPASSLGKNKQQWPLHGSTLSKQNTCSLQSPFLVPDWRICLWYNTWVTLLQASQLLQSHTTVSLTPRLLGAFGNLLRK